MANFDVEALVNHPREFVFKTNRDALDLVVPWVDDLDRVVEDRRFDRGDGIVEITNIWYAKAPIPSVLQAIISPHMLVWTDYAVWSEKDFSCSWRLASNYFPHHFRCVGTTRFKPTSTPQRTIVSVSGSLSADPSGLPLLPNVAAEKVTKWLEEFIGGIIPLGVRNFVDGISRAVDQRSASAKKR